MSQRFPELAEEELDFILACLAIDPQKRASAEFLLNHAYLAHESLDNLKLAYSDLKIKNNCVPANPSMQAQEEEEDQTISSSDKPSSSEDSQKPGKRNRCKTGKKRSSNYQQRPTNSGNSSSTEGVGGGKQSANNSEKKQLSMQMV